MKKRKQSTLLELCYEYSGDDINFDQKDWHEAKHLVKIFDNYAIEFLNYYLHNKSNSRYAFSNLSSEESLEKFKQEKKL
jgi:hypothetical protein